MIQNDCECLLLVIHVFMNEFIWILNILFYSYKKVKYVTYTTLPKLEIIFLRISLNIHHDRNVGQIDVDKKGFIC